MPVLLEEFLKLGQRLQQIRKVNVINSGSTARACSARWFLDRLDQVQKEHFRDWLLINSTCRSFRAWGKKAFFSEKIFVLKPLFMKTLLGGKAKPISAENWATAQTCIRHVVVPARKASAASLFLALSRYHALQRLRSLTIHLYRYSSEIPLSFYSSTIKPSPPVELLSLLRDLDLQVDQLQMDLNYDRNSSGRFFWLSRFVERSVYPVLRLAAERKIRERF